MTRTQQTHIQAQRTVLSPTMMESVLQHQSSPGPSSIFSPKQKEPALNYSFNSPTSPLSPSRDYRHMSASPPPPPPAGRAFTATHAPRSASESLAHPTVNGGGGLSRVSRPRDEIRDLTDNERLRLEWDILLRKKDKYKTWKKRTKDEWRELQNEKVLMEANRQRLREDEVLIRTEKQAIEEQRASLDAQLTAFRTLQKQVGTERMEIEEQRMHLADDRQSLLEDMEKFQKERIEYEEERRKHAEESVVLRREWEEVRGRHDAEMRRMDEARQEFSRDLARYEREMKVVEGVRRVLDEYPDSEDDGAPQVD